jgi:hypothetical protein
MLTAEHNFDLMSGVKSEKGGKLNRRRVCRSLFYFVRTGSRGIEFVLCRLDVYRPKRQNYTEVRNLTLLELIQQISL